MQLRSRSPRLVVVTTIALALLASCGGGGGAPDAGDDPVLSRGREVWVGQCARCHGPSGGGGSAPRIAGAVERLFPDAQQQIRLVEQGRGLMPAFGGRLSADDIEAVVRYTREVL